MIRVTVYRSRITEHLGSGEFGTVCKGQWHTDQGELDVAVKMLNCKASEEATVRFLQEAAIMGQFRHPNIVRLHGVVTVGEPVGGLTIHTNTYSVYFWVSAHILQVACTTYLRILIRSVRGYFKLIRIYVFFFIVVQGGVSLDNVIDCIC